MMETRARVDMPEDMYKAIAHDERVYLRGYYAPQEAELFKKHKKWRDAKEMLKEALDHLKDIEHDIRYKHQIK